MNVAEIGGISFAAVVLALILTIGALRLLPPRADQVGPQGQTGYLMNQLIAKNEETHALRVELDQTKVEVSVLKVQIVDRDKRIVSLEAQVSDLWAMLRNQGIRIDETRAATNAAYNEPRRAGVRVPLDVTLSEDIPFRDWLTAHFDLDDLRTLCADMKLAEFPQSMKLEQAATYTVFEARKNGKLSALESVALDKRPHVSSW